MSEFKNHIKSAISNGPLQEALDKNAKRRQEAKQNAFSSLPDYQARRAQAHSIRRGVIDNLDENLVSFTNKAKENGWQIHFASNADEARKKILDISIENHVQKIAKSKTMVSEEINLNHILEEHEIEVVETDLGEYIVQLRGEKPSHIITPAVHLRREDVGRTFNEKLGIPFTENIPSMTNTARKILRDVFLSADIGISGVNFGIVETGGICIVTNEGNGRMVTTLPKIHIALMGIERLVPTMEDLSVLLTLLPRSATGQKITVYTQLINKPRQEGEIDGAIQRHLVLLDNGRRFIQKSNLAEALLCIRCGACLNVCPIFREIGGHAYVNESGEGSTYTGPIGSVISPMFFGPDNFGQLARASTLCGACREACPVDIDLPQLLLRVRAGNFDKENKSADPIKVPSMINFGMKLYSWIVVHPKIFKRIEILLSWLLRIAPEKDVNGSASAPWVSLPKFTGWGLSRKFPLPQSRSFRERFSSIQQNLGHQIDTDVEASQTSGEQGSDNTHEIQNLADQFQKEITILNGVVIPCTLKNLDEKIYQLLVEKNITRIQTWDQEYLPEKLVNQLEKKGVKTTRDLDPLIKAGLTGSLGGIADTGTIIIPAGKGKPLTASLVPEIHLAVLAQSKLKANLQQALVLPEVKLASSVALVSGPSRTADIEMTLTIGVHGPREIYVFLLSDI